MKKFMMTLAAALVSAAAFGQVLRERKIDPPKGRKEYYFIRGAVQLDKIPQPGKVKVTVVASGDAKVGCRLRVFQQQGKPEFKTVFWNRQLKGGSAKYSASTDFSQAGFDAVKKHFNL